MPELPDVTVYVERLVDHVVGRPLERVRLKSPFLLRTVEPPLAAVEGRVVAEVRRLGKRLVFGFAGPGDGSDDGADDALFLVLHLMIAGRLRWRKPGAGLPGKMGLAAFDFEHGTLVLTEASPKKRASLHVVRGEAGLAEHDRGGLELAGSTAEDFAAALRRENHTLKRALTDPRLLSGIGNAYSDEILHRAGLSPLKWTSRLGDEEVARLHAATQECLATWVARLEADCGERFPDKLSAFHGDMAVHGKYGEPCPVCGAPVQRIKYASNETNYCAGCQTGGKLLKDRALSQLLHDDWPRSLDEL